MNSKAIKKREYPEKNILSHSDTHYLIAIKELRKELGYARLTDIAHKLKITPGSCSLKLKTLRKKRLVQEDKNKFLRLSKKGTKLMKVIEKTARLFGFFFREVLYIKPRQAAEDSCKIEHLMSIETASNLCFFLHFLQKNREIIQNYLKEMKKGKNRCSRDLQKCDICEMEEECLYNSL